MGVSKSGEGGWNSDGMENFEEKNANITNGISKLIYVKVSSKSDNGKVFKFRGIEGGYGISRKKKKSQMPSQNESV